MSYTFEIASFDSESQFSMTSPEGQPIYATDDLWNRSTLFRRHAIRIEGTEHNDGVYVVTSAQVANSALLVTCADAAFNTNDTGGTVTVGLTLYASAGGSMTAPLEFHTERHGLGLLVAATPDDTIDLDGANIDLYGTGDSTPTGFSYHFINGQINIARDPNDLSAVIYSYHSIAVESGATLWIGDDVNSYGVLRAADGGTITMSSSESTSPVIYGPIFCGPGGYVEMWPDSSTLVLNSCLRCSSGGYAHFQGSIVNNGTIIAETGAALFLGMDTDFLNYGSIHGETGAYFRAGQGAAFGNSTGGVLSYHPAVWYETDPMIANDDYHYSCFNIPNATPLTNLGSEFRTLHYRGNVTSQIEETSATLVNSYWMVHFDENSSQLYDSSTPFTASDVGLTLVIPYGGYLQPGSYLITGFDPETSFITTSPVVPHPEVNMPSNAGTYVTNSFNNVRGPVQAAALDAARSEQLAADYDTVAARAGSIRGDDPPILGVQGTLAPPALSLLRLQ